MSDRAMERDEAEKALSTLPGWAFANEGKGIAKIFEFANFREAFAFMTQSALMAEKLDHHPEWSNVYKRVEVTLSTHSADGLTELDFKLAAAMEEAAG